MLIQFTLKRRSYPINDCTDPVRFQSVLPPFLAIRVRERPTLLRRNISMGASGNSNRSGRPPFYPLRLKLQAELISRHEVLTPGIESFWHPNLRDAGCSFSAEEREGLFLEENGRFLMSPSTLKP